MKKYQINLTEVDINNEGEVLAQELAIIDKGVEILKKIDWENISMNEVRAIVYPMFKNFLINPLAIAANSYIWRGRIVKKKPEFRKDLMNPEEHFIKSFGRCNNIGKSVFYASFDKYPIFNEIQAKVGDQVAMGFWRVDNPIPATHVGFTQFGEELLEATRKLDHIYLDRQGMKRLVGSQIEFYDLISKHFIQRVPENADYLYKLSIVITEALMDEKVLHGLVYPSIAYSGDADNIVLSKEIAQTLKFVSVEYLEIIKIEGKQFQYKTLDTADAMTDENKILWSGNHFNSDLAESGKLDRRHGSNYYFTREGKLLEPKSTGRKITSSALENRFYEQFDDPVKFNPIIITFTWEMPGLFSIESEIISTVNFHYSVKESSISMLFPDLPFPEHLVFSFLPKYSDVLDEISKSDIIIEESIQNANGKNISVTNRECQFNNTLYIFCEKKFATNKLQDQFSYLDLVFVFGAQ